MIDYIKIEGFKSFRNLEIKLAPINILIGSNGSGKSNLLSFFQLFRAIFSQKLQKFVLEEKTDNILHFGRKHTTKMYAKTIFKNKDGNNNAYFFELGQDRQGGLFIRTEGSGYNVGYEDDSNNYFHESNLEESKVAISSSFRDKYLRDYIRTLKTFHFHDTSSTSALRRECDIDDNKALRSDGGNLPAYLFALQKNHPKIFLRIEKAIQSVAPYIDRLILEPRELSEGRSEISLRWADNGDSESSFSAYQLSDGTLRFIALSTLLMQPDPPAVIIIDEPELGLHPFAIGKLASMIQAASSQIQILAATQSASLIDFFKPEDILVVDRSKDRSDTIIRRLDNDKLATWLEEYSLGDLWEKNIINSAQPFQK
ncbi:AAA family ATPase [[Flexibacter] sp. ATCC 35208]|uniref:AAA family ATPase n=1 Tax=[Flexibacter] sp. ATCC 35208 TaxID=1936242 RepID=UPI0009C4AC91|nr:AAA family ATPase [[Flexibacter] sp. ATCC 35208]OMP79152.1 hypothetical protein BW716_11070 [[Flexibacter] sp. ATCC 35208]